MIKEKQNQKVALYPVKRASGLVLSGFFECAVTVAAMTATKASPTDFPIWLIELNTPPANACVLTGKTDVITRFEMVKSESAPAGLKAFARKAEKNISIWPYEDGGF